MQQHAWSSTCDRVIMSLQRCSSYIGFRSLKGSTSNYACLFTRHLLGMHHSTLRTLSGQWLICHREPRCGQHLVTICMCHEHVGGSETERLPLRPHDSRVWNSLPTDIKLHRSTTTSFKRRLKTVLFNRGFAEYMTL